MAFIQDGAPLITNLSANIQIGLLETAGIDSHPVLEAAGLTRADLNDATLLISGTQELAVLRGFAQATANRQELWVELGLRYRLMIYFPVGFALITAPSLGRMLDLSQRFSQLHYGLMRYELIADANGNSGVEFHYDERLADIMDFLKCRDTIAFTQWLHEFWGGRFPFSRIEVGSPLPTVHGFDFRAPIALADDKSRWFWPKALMAETPALAEPVMHHIFRTQCETMLLNADRTEFATLGVADDPLMERIARLLEQSGRYDATIDQLASDLAMSRRSLQRKLADRGVSFRAIIDENRCRAAKELLRDRSKSIAEIAWELGFADASSLHQAFVRWTHMSLSAYRQRLK